MREIVIDTETTGLNYKGGDRIIEVGCVELTNHVPTNRTLQFYCFVDKLISESAQRISGITNKFLKDKKKFSEHCSSLINFIKNDTLIIHNAEFDMGFINNELKLIGKEPIKNKVIDTVPLARKVLNTRIANLDYLCRRFGVDLSKRKLHGALLDAELLAEVYLELRGGKQFSMDLSLNKSKKSIPNNNNIPNKNKILKIKANEQEIRLHKTMVESIKDSEWKKYNY